jgi:hypothetical protein
MLNNIFALFKYVSPLKSEHFQIKKILIKIILCLLLRRLEYKIAATPWSNL